MILKEAHQPQHRRDGRIRRWSCRILGRRATFAPPALGALLLLLLFAHLPDGSSALAQEGATLANYATEATAEVSPDDEPVVDDTWGSLYAVLATFVGLIALYIGWIFWQHCRSQSRQPPAQSPGTTRLPASASPRYTPQEDPDNPFREDHSK